jgi:hypothetical protein
MAAMLPVPRVRSVDWSRAVDVAAGGAVVLVALLALQRMLQVAALQLAAPFDLIFESPGLATVENLRAGLNVYSASVYAEPPFNLQPYTPLYFLLVAALPVAPGNLFLTGRLVTLACVALLCASAWRVAGPRDRWLALGAVAAYLLIPAVVSNATFLRHDFMALLLSTGAVLAAAAPAGGLGSAALAAVLAFAAFATKQSHVAAGIACGAWLFLQSTRRAQAYCATLAASALAGAATAQWLWGDGFWFSVFGALRNPMTLAQFSGLLGSMLSAPAYALSVAALLATLVWRRHALRADLRASPWGLYWLASSAVLLGTIAKEGSAQNYFFEPVWAGLLWLVSLHRAAPSPVAARLLAVALAIAAALELRSNPVDRVSFAPRSSWDARAATRRVIKGDLDDLKAAPRRVLQLVAVLHGEDFGGTRIELNDPYLYALLFESGALSMEPLVAAVRRRHYDVIAAPPGEWAQPFTLLRADVAAHYVKVGSRGPFDYWVPALAAGGPR